MDQGLLPRRYAKALYKYAVERDVAAQMYTVMDTLTKAYDDNASLQATIANPFVDNARKASILATDSDAIGQQNPKLLGIQDTHNIAAALHQEALHLYRTEKML